MTLDEYQKKLLELTAEFVGATPFTLKCPLRLQIALTDVIPVNTFHPVGMQISIGYISDLGDFQNA